jgi:DNA-binding transcriptional ArsR family regulator
MPDTTATVLDRYYDAWNRHDATAVAASFAAGGVYPDPLTRVDLSGDTLTPHVQDVLDVIRDLRIAVTRTVADEDAAAVVWASSPRGPAIVNSMVQYPTTVDRTFAALADPTRRAVLERLGAGSATISELAKPFGMSLTGMKKHVRLLEEAQLVTTEKVGRVRRCMLVPYAFEGISTWLQRLDRFAQVVERTKGAR